MPEIIDGKIEKFMTTDGTVRASAVICTDLINEAQKIHKSYPVGSAALGRALIGAGLLSTFMKDAGKIAFHFKGDGPLKSIFAEGDSDGSVRGFIGNPQVHVPSKNGKLNVGGAVGQGILSVAISLPDKKQPYTGSVKIQSGEIGEDIAYYLYQSQQTPSIVALGVFVEPDNSISAAGGCILQVMPGGTEKTLETLESRVTQIRSVTQMIREGAKTSDLAMELLEDFNFRPVEETRKLVYKCHCSMRRVERSLLLVGATEIQALIDKKEAAEVFCDFCGRQYLVELPILQDLLLLARSKSSS
jgi:molecular chaperone Hsp33